MLYRQQQRNSIQHQDYHHVNCVVIYLCETSCLRPIFNDVLNASRHGHFLYTLCICQQQLLQCATQNILSTEIVTQLIWLCNWWLFLVFIVELTWHSAASRCEFNSLAVMILSLLEFITMVKCISPRSVTIKNYSNPNFRYEQIRASVWFHRTAHVVSLGFSQPKKSTSIKI